MEQLLILIQVLFSFKKFLQGNVKPIDERLPFQSQASTNQNPYSDGTLYYSLSQL